MILGLDGLRAIAFLLVLATHTGNGDFGWMGVQLFFVLSGFLLTGILLRMKSFLNAREYFLKFYGRRILRIFPLYFAYLLFLSIAVVCSDSIRWELFASELQQIVRTQLVYAYFYVYDFFHASAVFQSTRFLRHFWSLSVEEQFYIFWPLILFLTPKEKLKTLFLSIIIAGPIVRLGTYFLYRGDFLPFLSDDPYMSVYVLPFSHVDAFAMGAYASCFQLTKPRKQLAILLYIVPLLGYITQYASTRTIQLDSLGYEFTLFTAYKFVWGYSLLNYCFALLIQAVAHTKLLTGILDHFTLRYLGRISYGLYVYHSPVIWFLLALQLQYKEQLKSFLYLGDGRTFFVVLLITTIISSISFYLFEKPINDLKESFFSLEPCRQKSISY